MGSEDWNRLPRRFRIALATLAAFSGTLVSSMAAWPFVEPYVAAHRGYVRAYSNDEIAKLRREMAPTKIGLYDIQISLAKTRRAAVNDRIITLEIEAPKSDSPTELIARRTQIEKLKEERAELNDDVNKLVIQRDKN